MFKQTDFTQLNNIEVIIITELDLEELRDGSEIVFEVDSLISGFIRIFKYRNQFLFQEQTPRGELLIRKFNDLNSANDLAKKRLDVYEKMWNGCGCKIEYFKI
jgi:hypothetical protein